MARPTLSGVSPAGFILNAGTRIPETDWDTLTQAAIDAYSWVRTTSTTKMTVKEFLAEVPNADLPPMDVTHVLKVVTENDSTGALVDLDLASTIDITYGNVGMWVMLPDSSPAMHSNDFRLQLFEDAGSGGFLRQHGTDPSPNTHYRDAWIWCGGNNVYKYSDDLADPTSIDRVRPVIRANAVGAVTAYITPVVYGIKHRTTFVLEQDDGQTDTDNFFADLDTNSLLGQLNLIPHVLEAAGKPIISEVQAYIATGHHICSHGVSNAGTTYIGPSAEDNWVDSVTNETDAIMRAAIRHELDTLQSLGFGEHRLHHALPEGVQNAAVLSALRDSGILSVRHVGIATQAREGAYFESGNVGGSAYMQCKGWAVEDTHAEHKTVIDNAIAQQMPLQRMYWHNYEAFRSETQDTFAYLARLQHQGLCDVMSFPDFYRRSIHGGGRPVI